MAHGVRDFTPLSPSSISVRNIVRQNKLGGKVWFRRLLATGWPRNKRGEIRGLGSNSSFKGMPTMTYWSN